MKQRDCKTHANNLVPNRLYGTRYVLVKVWMLTLIYRGIIFLHAPEQGWRIDPSHVEYGMY
jgi:hypothetical protein